MGLKVCHRCDIPACVNVDHLFLGTDADNIADRDSKGRQAHQRGEANGMAVLTEQDVLAIRSDAGSPQEISDKFHISLQHVSQIKKKIR